MKKYLKLNMNNNIPFFSVIIPTYNRADLLARCLKSLTEQTYKDFEVIVCDDGSTDNSKEITDKYLDKLNIQYLWDVNWGGPARPRNRGISAAKGDWICFLDSDDWWTPDKLENCLPYLDKNDIIFHPLQIFSENNGLQKKIMKGRQPKSPVFIDMLENENCVNNSSVVIRRSIIDKVGPLCENKEFVSIEDYEYWIRISLVTELFFYIPKILGYYWVGSTSITMNNFQLNRINYIYDKFLVYVKDEKVKREIISRQAYRNARMHAKFGYNIEAHEYFKKAVYTKHLYTKLKAVLFYFINKQYLK